MNRNEKIKLGLINTGVIGLIIVGASIYGELRYIRGIMDASKEMNNTIKEFGKNYKRGDYKKYGND